MSDSRDPWEIRSDDIPKGTILNGESSQRDYYSKMNDYPMKFHRFLIYFALWVGALMNLASGVNFLSGAQYGGSANLFYKFVDGLESLDQFIGIFQIALAAVLIFVRFELAKLKRNGPKLLIGTYAANSLASAVYSYSAYSMTRGNLYVTYNKSITEIFTTLGVSCIFIFLVWKYYKIREDLFTY